MLQLKPDPSPFVNNVEFIHIEDDYIDIHLKTDGTERVLKEIYDNILDQDEWLVQSSPMSSVPESAGKYTIRSTKPSNEYGLIIGSSKQHPLDMELNTNKHVKGKTFILFRDDDVTCKFVKSTSVSDPPQTIVCRRSGEWGI